MLPEDAISHGLRQCRRGAEYLAGADGALSRSGGRGARRRPSRRCIKLESTTQRFDLYDSLPDLYRRVGSRTTGVILFRNCRRLGRTILRQFKAPAPGRYRFRVSASAHNSETPLPMAVLLGNFVVSGNPTSIDSRLLRRAARRAGGHRIRGAAGGEERHDQGHRPSGCRPSILSQENDGRVSRAGACTFTGSKSKVRCPRRGRRRAIAACLATSTRRPARWPTRKN